MKTLTLLLLFILALANTFAASLTATFSGNNPPNTVEYFIEEKGGTEAAPVWTEVAKGPTSPISIANVQPGVRTYRIKARWTGVTATTGNGVSGPSAEAVGIIGSPSDPSNFIIGIVTVEVFKDGTMRIASLADRRKQNGPE